MDHDSHNRIMAGTPVSGAKGDGDVSLVDVIPKYLESQLEHQQPHVQQLVAAAVRAEAEIFYSCSAADLSFLHGAYEHYHLGESGDYLMTEPMHRFIADTAAAVAATPSCRVICNSRVNRIIDHSNENSSSVLPFDVHVEGSDGVLYNAHSVIVTGV
jgi:predicted secreted Zn-dependent protease